MKDEKTVSSRSGKEFGGIFPEDMVDLLDLKLTCLKELSLCHIKIFLSL